MKTQRRDAIIKALSESRAVKATELAASFRVSMETVRRDLAELEQEGIVRRIHGGAILNTGYSIEPDYAEREIKNFEEKRLIGKKAVSMVDDGDTIIIDIGTSTLEFAKMLKGKKKVTVLTNSLMIAFILTEDPDIKVIVFGGDVRHGEGTTSGFWAEEMVDGFYVDKLFLGVGAITVADGVMDYDIPETNLRRHFIRHSKLIVALADYSKFGIKALNVVCGTDKLDYLITDEKTDQRMLKDLKDLGVEVVIAH